MKKVSDFIIYGNLLIAACAGCFIWETYLLLGMPPDIRYIAFGFAATLFTYNIDRLAVLGTLKETHNERHNWVVRHRRQLWYLCLACLAVLAVLVIKMPERCIWFLAHLGILSIAYSAPAFLRGGKGLRSIKLLKIFLIMYVWAATTVILPALAAGLDIFGRNLVLLFAERALFIFAITLPFDIRDYVSDKASNVLTIPGLIGIPNTRMLAFGCLLAFFGLNLFHYSFANSVLWAKLLSGINALAAVYYASEKRHEYYYTGFIDATMIVQFLLVCAAVNS